MTDSRRTGHQLVLGDEYWQRSMKPKKLRRFHLYNRYNLILHAFVSQIGYYLPRRNFVLYMATVRQSAKSLCMACDLSCGVIGATRGESNDNLL